MSDNITVLNPACSSTMVERIPLTPRKFSSLENKTIFMIDIGWGGPTAGYDVFEVMSEGSRKGIWPHTEYGMIFSDVKALPP